MSKTNTSNAANEMSLLYDTSEASIAKAMNKVSMHYVMSEMNSANALNEVKLLYDTSEASIARLLP